MDAKPCFPDNESLDPLAPVRGLLWSIALAPAAWGLWWAAFSGLLRLVDR